MGISTSQQRKEYAIGIDLGGTNVRIGAANSHGLISKISRIATRQWEGPEKILDRTIVHIRKIIKELSTDYVLSGIGFGAPGPLDAARGIVYSMPNLTGWENFPLVDYMQAKLQNPVRIVNDADAIAFGEYNFGKAKGIPFFVLVTLGSGIGSSIFIKGRPWMGCSGISAELGHIPISTARIQCSCGRFGHVESFLSSRRVVERIVSKIKAGCHSSIPLNDLKSDGYQLKIVIDAARRSDKLAVSELNRYAKYLGLAFAVLVNLLNPPVIVLGGGVSSAWDILEPVAVRCMKKSVFDIQGAAVQFLVSELIDKAGILGAAVMMMEKMK